MPWPQRADESVITRQCCGVTVAATALWLGTVAFPHVPSCRFYRRPPAEGA